MKMQAASDTSAVGKSNRPDSLSDLPFPRWKDEWKRCFKPLAAIGFLADVLSLVVPKEVLQLTWWHRLVLLPVVVLVLPLVCSTLLWLVRFVPVVFRRVKRYPEVVSDCKTTYDIARSLAAIIERERRFKILSVQFYNDRVYVSIKRKRSPRLVCGDQLIVVTPTEDGRKEMGLFEICEMETNVEGYLARALKLDAVWSGYIHLQGEGELPPPPFSIAILVSQGESI